MAFVLISFIKSYIRKSLKIIMELYNYNKTSSDGYVFEEIMHLWKNNCNKAEPN